MSADQDPALLTAARVLASAAVAGSAVAIRDELPGQPCGISVPLTATSAPTSLPLRMVNMRSAVANV
jgi:hypothetical protein